METENNSTNSDYTNGWSTATEDPAAQQQFTEFPPIEPPTRENILAGFVGAFLFALIGGVLYFLIYQLGIIAGICGLITFVLANFGYGLLSGNRKGNSIPGLVAAILMTLVMIFLAEYLCVAYEIYRAAVEELYYDGSFIDVLRAMPEFLSDSELRGAFIGDLVFAYLLGAFASVGTIISAVKERKRSRV